MFIGAILLIVVLTLPGGLMTIWKRRKPALANE